MPRPVTADETAAYMALLDGKARDVFLSRPPDDRAFFVSRWLDRERNRAAAKRLGLEPHEQQFEHMTVCLVDMAEGDEAGKALAAKYGLRWDYAGAMWHEIDERNDAGAQARIKLVANDQNSQQGRSDYWIVVESLT